MFSFVSALFTTLIMNMERSTLASKGVDMTAKQAAARKSVPTISNSILTLSYAGDERLIEALKQSEIG